MSDAPHEQPTADLHDRAGETRDVSAGISDRADAVGQTISGYEVLGTLGSGGFGVVFRARDETGREVALKLLSARPGAQVVARFRREGQAAAALSHSGIVRIHAAGEHRGQPWLAYELVPGARDLETAFAGADLRQRVAWVRDAARALGAAHAQGILHRDVKPENLLVDAAGQLRVVDFGLAVLRGEERLTETNLFLGTPAYTAPEQARDPKRVGPTADVWSLGVVLFQALTGRHPMHDCATPQELLARLVAGRLPRPRALAPGVDPALDAICARAMHRSPASRHPDGAALADDLDAWLEGRASPPRRWALLVAVGVILVAVGLALLGTTQPSARPSSPTLAASPPAPAPAAAPAPELRRRWSQPLAGAFRGLRFLSGRVFVAAGDAVVARRAANGEELWRRGVEGEVVALAALTGSPQRVFAADATGRVRCWTVAGRALWTRRVGKVRGLLVAEGLRPGAELIVDGKGGVLGFDLEGNRRWKVSGGRRPQVGVDERGAGLLLVRKGDRAYTHPLGLVSQGQLARLLRYHRDGLGRPALAELDGEPGTDVVLPSPGLVECRTGADQAVWRFSIPVPPRHVPEILLASRDRRSDLLVPARPDLFVRTGPDTVWLNGKSGEPVRTYRGLRVLAALGGDLVGVRGEALVSVRRLGELRWQRPCAGRVVEVRSVGWRGALALLLRTERGVWLLDAAGKELGVVEGRADAAEVVRLSGAEALLVVRAGRLEAWR